MGAISNSTAVFVTLSGLFWSGWILGSQTPEGQEALARAYAAYAEEQAAANEDLFDTTALRAIVCGGAGAERAEQKPCLAVIAAGRLFIVDAGSGATNSLTSRNVPLARLQAVLLTQAGLPQTADLSSLFGESAHGRGDAMLPVYGPAETQRLVDGLNQAGGFDGATSGLQAWGPSPEPGRAVIVFEADGLVVSAFTTQEDAFNGRIGYRFDYRGRSMVVGGDGRVVTAEAAANADVVLQNAHTQALARTDGGAPSATEAATRALQANAQMMVLTGAGDAMAAHMQLSEARAAGFDDVVAGRDGMVVELPLVNTEINVHAL